MCAQNKRSTRPRSGLLHPLPVPSCPWSHIALDFVSCLPSSEGKTVILTIVDRFSKAFSLPCQKSLQLERPQTSWSTMSSAFMVCRLTVSDRGPQFTSQVWKAFCTALGATVSLSSGYHPQTNGQAEWANQELETALRCLSSANPSSWSSQLPLVEYAHNSLPSASSGMSPFLCSLGYQPPLFPAQEDEISVLSVQAHIRRCRRTWRRARTALLRAAARS